MSDDEEVMHEEEEEGEEEPKTPTRKVAPVEDKGPSEAELAMQKRREAQTSAGLDEDAEALLEENRKERQKMEEEIQELRERNERRKREREEEERAMALKRAEEERARKAEEEERKRKKEEDELQKREERALKMAEFEKWKNPPKANFVITKRDDGATTVTDEGDENVKEKKSREQLDAEKKAILTQRVKPLEISGFDQSQLKDKAKELLNQLYRLESERYDLEKRFKAQQYDMTELAERARQAHKVGKAGAIKRVNPGPDDSDKMQERFAGCPTKIVMYSEYERQKDKRAYDDRQVLYTGPQFGYPADRIKPERIVRWGEDGLPIYEELAGEGGGEAAPVEAEAE